MGEMFWMRFAISAGAFWCRVMNAGRPQLSMRDTSLLLALCKKFAFKFIMHASWLPSAALHWKSKWILMPASVDFYYLYSKGSRCWGNIWKTLHAQRAIQQLSFAKYLSCRHQKGQREFHISLQFKLSVSGPTQNYVHISIFTKGACVYNCFKLLNLCNTVDPARVHFLFR